MDKLSMKFDFRDKVVVITGAGGVICSEMVKAFAIAGAKVAAVDRKLDRAEKLSAELREKGYICYPYASDVLIKDELRSAHSKIASELGRCDILVNGAGGNSPLATTDNEYHHIRTLGDKDFFALDSEGIDCVFRLNFQGTLLPTQVFAADMAEHGSGAILNISSMNAYTPLTKIPAYSGAKAAVTNFTSWLAVYFAGTGIRCNAIAPGFLVSKQNKELLYNPDGTPTKRSKKILSSTPMGRFVSTDELLWAALFLCDGEKASAITGVTLPIDCGFSSYSGV